jgi:Rhodopirellula transposase DDE domain
MTGRAADQLMLKVLDTLNEAQGRWFVAREVLARGRGGLKALHEATGMSRPTILKGIRELRAKKTLTTGERVRRSGGGRKRLEALDPGWERALDRIMDENTAGDPMSLLRWTNKSTARIAEELTRQGHAASDETVRRRLGQLGYSLQANVKTLEESGVGRDEQFRYLNRQVKRYLAHREPVLSVDTKKKERVGNFKNSGQTWRPAGQPLPVNLYDYPHLGKGPAIPYGAYDVHRNEGFVNVGMSHDTAEFAVESLRRWWKLFGRRHYPQARRLLLCADGGGSNGSRNRAWKYYLQQWADQLGLEVTVCHYPPGTSKWNKIEHRLFSFISLNWKGQPLVSYETVVNLIGATRTQTGLRVRAELDAKQYEAGVKIPDEEMERINLRPHSVNPLWNYTISPRTVQAS